MDRERIERQLKLAQDDLARWEKELDGRKVAAKQRSKDPKWRALNADLRALKRRMNAVKAVEEREAAAIERKANAGQEAVATDE